MNPKRLLLYSLLTNLICTFPAGHAIIPLGLFEPLLIYGTIKGETESQIMWVSSTILLLLGQIIIIFALTKSSERRMYQFGQLGLLFLTSTIITVYFTMYEQVWIITFVTAIPFIITSTLFITSKQKFK
jgi:hypothetical protein